MAYCPLYNCECEMAPWCALTRNPADAAEEELYRANEEEEYYLDLMRQPAAEINRILRLLNREQAALYNELAGRGINRALTQFLFRFIIGFTINNEDNFSGGREQKANALLNALRTQHPWLFFFLRSAGIPAGRVNQIIRIVIIFVLVNIEKPPVPPVDLEQLATRITNQIRQQTDVFIDLQAFGVPANVAYSMVRTVVLFTLRNINFNQPPADINERTNDLLALLEASNLDVIQDMRSYGIPIQQIRNILRTIIRFTLQQVYSREEY